MTKALSPLSSLLFILFLGLSVCVAQSAPRFVDLTAADGIQLKASYFAASKPGPGVLLLHQCNKQRKIWDGLAGQLASAGINVLTLDLRGFGESGDTPQDKATPQEAQAQAAKWPGDIDVAYQYLVSQAGVKPDRIGIGGASCGVNNSVQTALRHPEVKSLALLAGSTDLKGRKFLSKKGSLPVLFVVADDDEFPTSIQTTEWLYSVSSNPGKEFLRYPNGGHGAEIFPVHPELPRAIVDWFVATLIKTPGRASAAKNVAEIPQQIKNLHLLDEPGGVAKLTEMVQQAHQRDPKAVLFPQEIVNVVGYEHLLAGDKKGAIEILKLNAFAFPDSPNVYDSLSDAYLADGQTDLARDNVKKTLELLPSDTVDPPAFRDGIKNNAEQKLKQLGDKTSN